MQPVTQLRCNPEPFFRDILPVISPQGYYAPLVGIDECLNRGDLHSLLAGLFAERAISVIEPLWYQFRRKPSGDTVIVRGSKRAMSCS
jgi:hypothetical protein